MKMQALLGVALVALSQSVMAVQITVTPSSAPNAFGSPSYTGYVQNSIQGQLNGLSSYGDPSSPTFYSTAPANMSVRDNIVTGFPSWKGTANPGTAFGPSYANELGNRLLFGVLIDGGGTKFSISQLGFNAVSTDPFASLSFGFAAGAYVYSLDYQGILYGADGVLGGGDDTYVTSGPNTQLVDGLVGRGSGNAWAVYDTSDPIGGTRQDKIDLAVSDLESYGPFTFTGTYTLGTLGSGSGTVAFNTQSVPDGGMTFTMLSAGVIGLAALRRRK